MSLPQARPAGALATETGSAFRAVRRQRASGIPDRWAEVVVNEGLRKLGAPIGGSGLLGTERILSHLTLGKLRVYTGTPAFHKIKRNPQLFRSPASKRAPGRPAQYRCVESGRRPRAGRAPVMQRGRPMEASPPRPRAQPLGSAPKLSVAT